MFLGFGLCSFPNCAASRQCSQFFTLLTIIEYDTFASKSREAFLSHCYCYLNVSGAQVACKLKCWI
jgi:hypothetical protein